jgi:hypothetical protein
MDRHPETTRLTVAAQAAVADPSWMRHPERVGAQTAGIASALTIVPIASVPFFDQHQFFAVSDPTEKPGVAIVIAVSDDLTATVLRSPNDFGQLLADLKRPIESDSAALEIAEQFAATLGANYPQYTPNVVVLDSIGDIPPRPGSSIPTEIRGVQPPLVEPTASGYQVTLWTWSRVGGDVRRLTFDVSRSGDFSVDVRQAAEGVGASWLPK